MEPSIIHKDYQAPINVGSIILFTEPDNLWTVRVGIVSEIYPIDPSSDAIEIVSANDEYGAFRAIDASNWKEHTTFQEPSDFLFSFGDSSLVDENGFSIEVFHEQIKDLEYWVLTPPKYTTGDLVYITEEDEDLDNLESTLWCVDSPASLTLSLVGDQIQDYTVFGQWSYFLRFVPTHQSPRPPVINGEVVGGVYLGERYISDRTSSPFLPEIRESTTINVCGAYVCGAYAVLSPPLVPGTTLWQPSEIDFLKADARIYSEQINIDDWVREKLGVQDYQNSLQKRPIETRKMNIFQWSDPPAISPEARGALTSFQDKRTGVTPRTMSVLPPTNLVTEAVPELELFSPQDFNSYSGSIQFLNRDVRLDPETVATDREYWRNMPDLPYENFTDSYPKDAISITSPSSGQSIPGLVDQAINPPLEHGSRLSMIAKDTYRYYGDDGRYPYWNAWAQGDTEVSARPIPRLNMSDRGTNQAIYRRLDAILSELIAEFGGKWEAVQWIFAWVLWSLGHPSWESFYPEDHAKAHSIMQTSFPFSAFILDPYDYLGVWLHSLSDDRCQFELPKSMEQVREDVDSFFASESPFADKRFIPFFDRDSGTGRYAIAASDHTLEIYPFAYRVEGDASSNITLMAYLINCYLYAPWVIFPVSLDASVVFSEESLADIFGKLNQMQDCDPGYFQRTEIDAVSSEQFEPIQVRSPVELLPYEEQAGLFELPEGYSPEPELPFYDQPDIFSLGYVQEEQQALEASPESVEEYFALPEPQQDIFYLPEPQEQPLAEEFFALPEGQEDTWEDQMFLEEYNEYPDEDEGGNPPLYLPPGG
jgi:hypothetical protein